MGVGPEDGIVDTGEALVVLSVEPPLLLLEGVGVGLVFYPLVVLLEEVGHDFVVVVVGADVQKSAVLGVSDLVDDGQQALEQLLGFFLVEGLDGLEQLFLVHLCHIYIVVAAQ